MKKLCAAALLLLLLLLLVWQAGRRTVGCSRSQLTQTPDDSFASGARAASANTQQTEPEEPKLVCLTFDDGPSAVTEGVLDILREEKTPATFFVMAADNNKQYLPLVVREGREGHQVALHTCSHDYAKIYASASSYWQDVKELRQQLARYIDVSSIYWLRFPGGSTNTVSQHYGGRGIMENLKRQADELGYRYMDWNVSADDAVGGDPSAQQILQNVIRSAKDKNVCVVLMHDTAVTESTREALPDIIAWFRQRGYRFCTVEQMYEEVNG